MLSSINTENLPFLFFFNSDKMKPWLLLMFVLHDVHTVSVRLIPNASLTLVNSSSSSIMNGTEKNCLCAMVMSSNIAALNFFSNNTCELFSNASLIDADFSWTINVNVNSLLYIRYLPIRTEISTSYSTATTNAYTSAGTSTAASVTAGKHS
jgi:hypothetical protein